MEIKKILIESDKFIDKLVELSGWIRFKRVSKTVIFLTIFDGSNLDGIQVIVKNDSKYFETVKKEINLFSGIEFSGLVKKNNNNLEIVLNSIENIYHSNENYQLGKKEHGLEFLREIADIRPRTKLFQAIMQIRSNLSFAIHEFFNQNKFLYVHSPIITTNDAEGAGELFYLSMKEEKNIFSSESSLTVSGQLHAESYAQAFKNVYTFGPTFRAENSNTPRHAAEFWMIEPESAFKNYFEIMDLGEGLLKFLAKKILNNFDDELNFLEKYFEKNLKENLNKILNNKFIKISYTKAIDILQNAVKGNVSFEDKEISFGIDLKTEHEKYLAEVYANGPIYVYDYPKEIKAFYMYLNDDQKTVRGFDLLVPGIGELIGGSERENRYEFLINSAKKQNISISKLNWYFELRKYGYAQSSGFGIGFERLVMLFTGVENIRDVLPFPRTPGKIVY